MVGPVASKIYLEAPATQKATLHLANLVVIGPKGAGKTSLVRCLRGGQFRQREQPTALFDVPLCYCELVSHKPWELSLSGLVYDNELARVVIDNLLKESSPKEGIGHLREGGHFKASSDSPPPLPPPIPTSLKRPASIHLSTPPPLPTRPRPQRMSMLLESSSAADWPMKLSGSHPEGLNVISPTSPTSPPSKRSSIKRRFSLSRLFRKSSTTNSHVTNNSHSVSKVSKQEATPPSSPLFPVRSSSVPGFSEPPFVSAIPDNLMSKLKDKLRDCMSGSLPPEVYGRLIDVPSQLGNCFFKGLLLTKSSVVIAVFDTSLDDPAKELLRELHSLLSLSPSLVSIVLVGTHSDCHSSFAVAKQRLNEVRQAVKESPFGRYLANGNFIVSCSSIFDQSTIEDVKKYVVDLVKSKCQSEVPLRWLRCIRRFQSLSGNGQYFISLTEARGIIKELCMVSNTEEVEDIIKFLHTQLVVLCIPQLKSLQNVVFTDPPWLLESCSKLLGLGEASAEASVPLELKNDYRLAITQGTLTDHLLEYLCSSTSKSVKQQLLLLLNSLELVGVHSSQPLSVSPWESEKSLVTSPITTPSPTPSLSSSSNIISSVIVPSIIQEQLPEHILPSSLEPLYFIPSCDFSPVSIIFLRLLIRCLRTHSSCATLYKDAGCFLINPETMMLVQKKPGSISVSLHPSGHPASPSLSLSSTSSYMPSVETALTVLMFVRPALSDICQTWSPGVEFVQAFMCKCGSSPHYVCFEESTLPGQLVKCQRGTMVPLPVMAAPWFGEEVPHPLPLVVEKEEEKAEKDDEGN